MKNILWVYSTLRPDVIPDNTLGVYNPDNTFKNGEKIKVGHTLLSVGINCNVLYLTDAELRLATGWSPEKLAVIVGNYIKGNLPLYIISRNVSSALGLDYDGNHVVVIKEDV